MILMAVVAVAETVDAVNFVFAAFVVVVVVAAAVVVALRSVAFVPLM